MTANAPLGSQTAPQVRLMDNLGLTVMQGQSPCDGNQPKKQTENGSIFVA